MNLKFGKLSDRAASAVFVELSRRITETISANLDPLSPIERELYEALARLLLVRSSPEFCLDQNQLNPKDA